MGKPKVFVSFASSDSAFSRRLLARLRAQPLEIWDYSREGEEIPAGVRLVDYLQQRIGGTEVFMPVISPGSFASAYAPREVEHALRLQRAGGLRVIPIRLKRCAWPAGLAAAPADPLNNPWPPPYDQLHDLRYFEAALGFFSGSEQDAAVQPLEPIARVAALRKLAAEERESLEKLLADVCRALDVPFVPLYVGDPQLPLLQRFEAELDTVVREGAQLRHAEHTRATYARLCDIRAELGGSLAGGDFDRALNSINYFLALCEYELPESRFYYPYIVKAVCLMASGQLPAAMEVLLPLQHHRLADESLFSALGVIHHRQGHYAEAFSWYQRADKAAAGRNIFDLAAKHGSLYTALLCGANVDVAALLRQIESAGVPRVEDRLKVQSLKAFAYARLGRVSEALEVYGDMLRQGMIDADAIMNYADLLRQQEAPRSGLDEAVRLLEQHATQCGPSGPYRDRLVMFNWQRGDMKRALYHGRLLLTEQPAKRTYWIHVARVAHEAGEATEAARVARTMLDPARFGLPLTPNDFYCDGMANWLLGSTERAQYDFERSGRSAEHAYARVLPR